MMRMNPPASADPADLFFQHLSALRRYAERTFVEAEMLTTQEDADKAARMLEFFDVGEQCEFSQKQLVTLIYADLLDL